MRRGTPPPGQIKPQADLRSINLAASGSGGGSERTEAGREGSSPRAVGEIKKDRGPLRPGPRSRGAQREKGAGAAGRGCSPRGGPAIVTANLKVSRVAPVGRFLGEQS